MKYFETLLIMTIGLHNTMIIIKKEKKDYKNIYIYMYLPRLLMMRDSWQEH